eukprot:2963526-Prymnesium_polylepis.1
MHLDLCGTVPPKTAKARHTLLDEVAPDGDRSRGVSVHKLDPERDELCQKRQVEVLADVAGRVAHAFHVVGAREGLLQLADAHAIALVGVLARVLPTS